MTDALYIFAEIKPKPNCFEQARQAIINILKDTRAEEGCYAFDLLKSPDGHSLYLFEKWKDHAALEMHHAMPYTAAVFKLYENWLAEPPRIIPMHNGA